MKKRVVQIIEDNDIFYGQVSNPLDLMKAQEFLHDRISNWTRDFLNNSNAHEVKGFAYELDADNAFDITVTGFGRIYGATNGRTYDLLENPTLTVDDPDATHPRIDLLVAVLEDDVDAETAQLPFMRLRTTAELSNGTAPYPPTNFSRPAEEHCRAVVQIRKGTASATPALPTLNSNEVPLYSISVGAGALKIQDTDIADLRNIILSLRQINDYVKQNNADIASLMQRLGFDNIQNALINLPLVFGQIRTLGDILSSLQRQISSSAALPEIRYQFPKVNLTDPDSAKIRAVGLVETGVPCVDIEMGGVINFNDKEITLHPDNFEDETLNARFAAAGGGPFQFVGGSSDSTETLETDLTLDDVTQIASDGAADFDAQNAVFSTKRSQAAAAPRNDRYIEVFGGLAVNNSDALSEWATYDTQNDTLTPRTPSSALPASDRPEVISYGDGTHVLIIAGNSSGAAPRCFKLNAVTGVVTEIMTTKPTGKQFFGDLIASGKIFVVACSDTGANTFWEFDTAAGTFTQLGTTGSVPVCRPNFAAGCYFKQNQFVVFKFTTSPNYLAQTYVFNRDNSTWTEINITQPDGMFQFGGFSLANVSGRPTLIGVQNLLSSNTIWQLMESAPDPDTGIQSLSWKSWIGTVNNGAFQNSGIASTLLNGTASGSGFVFAGKSAMLGIKTDKVYALKQAGLVAASYKGQDAISIADSSTFATFIVPVHENYWQVAGYLANFTGDFNNSNVKIEVSLDDGDNWQQIVPNQYADIVNSDTPGARQIRVTLYNLGSSKPTLAKLTEVFDETGVTLEDTIVIRYDAPNSVKALYVTKEGKIILSSTIEPSTPSKCLLHKVMPDGSNAPDVKNYINRRQPHVKYSKERVSGGGAASLQFDNELAVPVRYVDARAFKADKTMYKIADPQVDFDALVDVTEVATVGDTWIVELEG